MCALAMPCPPNLLRDSTFRLSRPAMDDVTAQLAEIVGDKNLLTGDAISEDYAHDEALSATPQKPAYVAKPATAEEVAGLLRLASEHRLPVTARGSGSGLSGAARPGGRRPADLFRADERCARGRRGQPRRRRPAGRDAGRAGRQDGRSRAELHRVPGRIVRQRRRERRDQRRGMRAVKYGVTRNNVLGLEAVLPTGEIIRTGGKIRRYPAAMTSPS